MDNESNKAALRITNMFDCDVSYLIDGINIDRPFDAMSLTCDLYMIFGNFHIFFNSEPISDQENTYKIDTFLLAAALPELQLPITRTLCLTSDQSIGLLLYPLLILHRAITCILHLSSTGACFNGILWDMMKLGT
ncbi:hypothetical protein CISG_03084 [Coccidioides immitis RMSCC 3703]|nr:hypothetical protein CISG_03084 [Coccidioides immitis RMSCC 3703]